MATWRFHAEEQGQSFEFESTSTFHSSSSTESHVSSVQEISIAGFTTLTETDIREFYEILDDPEGHMEMDHIETHIKNTIMGIVTEEDVTVTMNPVQYLGPATKQCEGETWTTPSVTATTVSSSFGTSSAPTESLHGLIESIDVVKTVEAGTFTCVLRKTVSTSGDADGWSLFTWIDRATGVMVKWELYDLTETLRGDAELVELN